MPTCPNGHQSGSEDWCEVCGLRMAAPGAPAGAVPPPPPPPPAHGYGYPPPAGPGAGQGGRPELCPQCRTPREPMAPYCEECRWNFLTNTATSYTPLAPPHAGPGAPGGPAGGPGGPGGGLNQPSAFQGRQGPPAQQHDPYEYQGSRPSQVNRPAEPLSSEQGRTPAPPPSFQQQRTAPPFDPGPPHVPQSPSPQHGSRTGEDDWMLPPPSQRQEQQRYAEQQPYGEQQYGEQQPYGERQQYGEQQQYAEQQHVRQPPQQFQGHHPDQGGYQNPGHHPDQGHRPDQGHLPDQGGYRNQEQDPHRAPQGWTAVIAPDREYFLAMMQRSGPDATGLNLPAYSPEQQLPLSGTQMTIGRRRHSTGESPDIDLSVPPEDPGVSHQHAMLVQQPDGGWAVVDQNSTNGTTLNGAEDPIQPYVPVPLQDGDRVHVGAWTTITIRRG